jgi:hypothetical protein
VAQVASPFLIKTVIEDLRCGAHGDLRISRQENICGGILLLGCGLLWFLDRCHLIPRYQGA